ncbi:alpha/beta fold hydrolase [Streptococcus sp. 121]|uniref:alpha/beta fold hydrolase n=1 Tax=Streptococcus sp. 121 TaxID=2797637 RepID=UPI0018F0BBCF|nr:alpha/beta fold hydrolase [Streptococcus sp. 121]MBJ6746154.1 alpha/beta fold hydrolase [Streptococcus sp. 121]
MKYNKIRVNGLEVFYREAGQADKPVFLLLHGFPSASHQFRELMPLLEKDFHLIAPDLIGFGQSEAPDHATFDYTFDNLTAYVEGLLFALGIEKFYLYVFDYGAPIGFRIASKYPERILGIVSQNGNVYEEGLGKKWEARAEYWKNPTPELRKEYQSAFATQTIIGQYSGGEDIRKLSPDGYLLDIYYSQSEGYAERQSDLIFDYQSNVALYPKFQAYLKKYQPKLLAAWGKNDPSFVYQGALAFAKDNPNSRIELLDGGHFALETHAKEIANLILDYFKE